MAKNIKITVDNALMGTVELFASAPMVNSGVRQTMPVFLEKHTFKNGTITLSGLQETPADQSWHYRLFVYPESAYCPVAEGAMQYRFFLPSSVAATVDLTALPSAWAWTQNGTNYAWLGTPNASPSVELVDGKVKRTNYASNPSFETNELNWVNGAGGVRTQLGTKPFVGAKSLQVTYAAAGTFKYIGQSATISPGKSYIKASVAVRRIAGAGFAKLRVGYRDNPTTGALTYGALTSAVPIGNDWTIANIEHAIPATTQHLVVIVYASDTPEGTSVVAGSSWAIDAMNISLGSNSSDTAEPTYFDGSSLSK